VCVCLICLYRTLCLHINECVCECACKISACHGFTNVFVCTSASLNARTQCMNQYADGRLRSTLHKRTSTQRSREATRMPITMFVATIPNHTLRYVRSYTANRCLGALDLAFVCANRALCRWAGVKASRMLKVGIISSFTLEAGGHKARTRGCNLCCCLPKANSANVSESMMCCMSSTSWSPRPQVAAGPQASQNRFLHSVGTVPKVLYISTSFTSTRVSRDLRLHVTPTGNTRK
jgi:hypothetical protein